jgi:hypothetical protein
MPFTPAHAAAVLPLVGLLGPRAIPSALVIGSLVPDFAYFLPLGVVRSQSHSLPGLLWFCVPVGLATYVVFHLLLAAPLVSLLPPVADRLPPGRVGTMPASSWVGVIASLLVGALSHVIWDAFTHDGTPVVQAIPWLEFQIVSIDGYRIFVYKLLQHLSTVVGLLILAGWTARWMVRTPPRPASALPRMKARHRALVATAMILAVATWTLIEAWPALAGGLSGPTLQAFAFRAAVASLSSVAVVLIAFGIAWHLAMHRRDFKDSRG